MGCGCNHNCGSSCSCGCHGHGVRPTNIKALCAKPVPEAKLDTVVYQPQVGDDTGTFAPKFGAHHNTIVWYMANDALYIYDKEGQFTFFGKRAEIEADDKGYVTGGQMYDIKTALEEMDKQLQENIDSEATAREEKDIELQQAIETEAQEREEAIENLEAELEAEATTRQERDGELQSQIDAMGAASDVIDVVNSYADLESYDTKDVKLNDIIKVLNDETHDGAITYYRWDGSKWNYVGETGPYYTKAETDEKIQEAVDNVEIPERAKNLPQYIMEPQTENVVQKTDVSNIIRYYKRDLDTNTHADTGYLLGGATSTEAGLMTAEDKKNLDNLVAGGGAGGGGGKLYSEYGENTDGALTQKFVSDKLNGENVVIGNAITMTNPTRNVVVGRGANSNGQQMVLIGDGAAGTTDSVVLGYGAKAATNNNSVAVGSLATATHLASIAIGRSAKTSRNYELSIGTGDGSSEYSSRYIANVKAGEKDTDAVNVKQLNDVVGNIEEVLQTLNTGTGV